jgi:hypothetical protein
LAQKGLTKGHVRGKYFSSIKKKKDVIDSERCEMITLFVRNISYYSFEFRLTQSENNTDSDEQNENSLLISQHKTDATVGIRENKST